MVKFAFIVIAIVAGYVFFYKDAYPDSTVFRGRVLESKKYHNNSQNKKIDVFSYRDSSNQHVLLFAVLGDPEVKIGGTKNQYLGNFERQGFIFQHDGKRFFGRHADTAIYMTATKIEKKDSVIVYTEKGVVPLPDTLNDADLLFSELEHFSLRK
jgi:predicted membrane protein